MSALDIAAETGHWRSSQILLGGGPSPDQLRVEISLALQRVALVKNGVPVYRAQCSTGRQGYSTRRGRLRNYEQRTKPSFHHLPCGDALFHAPELSRLRNARRDRAELSSVTRMHSITRGSCPQVLLRDPNRNACDGAIIIRCCSGDL